MQVDKPDNLLEIEVAKTLDSPVGPLRVQPKKKAEIKIPAGGFKNLDKDQKANLAILAQTLYAGGFDLSPDSIVQSWPKSGMDAKIAGPCPELHDIANYMRSTEFVEVMRSRDVDYTGEEALTPEQMATVHYMAVNTGSQVSKLRKAGVTTAKWATWKRQRRFMEYYKEVMNDQLQYSIPEMKAALANRAMEGDVNALKFAFEVTGEYNPNYKAAVDAQALVGMIIDVMTSTIKDKELLGQIQNEISIRAQGIRGVG